MKRISLFCLVLACLSFTADNGGPDDIIGQWMNETGKAQIQIYKEGSKYFGKVVWLKDLKWPNGMVKTDRKNPDRNLQTKPVIGLVILRDFIFDDGEWTNGRVYDPENGKDYKCYMKLKDPKTLSMRGYIGFSLLGRTEIWSRVK